MEGVSTGTNNELSGCCLGGVDLQIVMRKEETIAFYCHISSIISLLKKLKINYKTINRLLLKGSMKPRI